MTRRHMLYDNHFSKRGETEFVTHAIFECPPSLQTWVLWSTPSVRVSITIWHISYGGKIIKDMELNRNIYPWII